MLGSQLRQVGIFPLALGTLDELFKPSHARIAREPYCVIVNVAERRIWQCPYIAIDGSNRSAEIRSIHPSLPHHNKYRMG